MTTHSLQCYITTFPSTPMVWNYIFVGKYIFGYSKSPHGQHFITGLLHMATTLGEAPEWESITTLGQHSLSSSRTTLQPHGQGHSTHHTFLTCRVNRRYRFNLDTVFTYRSLCNGYRITYTSRFGNILLLFLLVLTCQISALTFTTRYHTIYNCGWWCRGSTHLQMWWQGITAYKTSWESWPAYRVYTYMDRESMEAADTVISSSCTRIIGNYFQNPGNTEIHVTSVVRLRIASDTVPYGLIINEPCEWQ